VGAGAIARWSRDLTHGAPLREQRTAAIEMRVRGQEHVELGRVEAEVPGVRALHLPAALIDATRALDQ
jgi:hypothetical protein